MSESRVEFQGSGPFSIPVAQSASAKAFSDGVELTLYSIVGDDPHPRPIVVRMVHRVANALGHQLVKAAIEVETKKS